MADQYIAKRDMDLYGDYRIHVGEIIEPRGAPNDRKIFGDDTHWTSRFVQRTGAEPIECGTDGCARKFATLGDLDRHRRLKHAPEREDVMRFRRERAETRIAREEAGETIGGYPVERVMDTGKGKVPYVKLT